MDLGTSGTSIITTLVKGQVLTRIEKGKYNIDGYIWDRVKLSDGRQGYIATNYITIAGNSNDENNNDIKNELIKVICNSGLKVRENPGTNQKVLTYVDKGDILTRIESQVSNVNGYVWDKIVTSSGITGYIARGDSKEQYIEVIQNNNSDVSNENSNFKLENNNLICNPNTTVELIKQKYSNITVKRSDETIIETGNVGTGYKVTIDKNEYTVIKKGDTNGDGKVTPADATVVLRAYVGLSKLSNDANLASDTNKDGKITPADATVILRKYVGLTNIEI